MMISSLSQSNERKSTRMPRSSIEETLHPYYDNINGDRWLFAIVHHTDPVCITYEIRPPATAAALLADRVKYHFLKYKLNTIYSAQASRQLRNLAQELQGVHTGGGRAAVSQLLSSRANSCLCNHMNSWDGALYEALAADDWYCNSGVLQRPLYYN